MSTGPSRGKARASVENRVSARCDNLSPEGHVSVQSGRTISNNLLDLSSIRVGNYSIALAMSSTTFLASPKTIMVLSM